MEKAIVSSALALLVSALRDAGLKSASVKFSLGFVLWASRIQEGSEWQNWDSQFLPALLVGSCFCQRVLSNLHLLAKECYLIFLIIIFIYNLKYIIYI